MVKKSREEDVESEEVDVKSDVSEDIGQDIAVEEPTIIEDDEGEETTKENEEVEETIEELNTCFYDVKKKVSSKLLETEDIDNELTSDDFKITNKRLVNSEDRITEPKLYKYERVRLLAERRTQLQGGAKPMVNVGKNVSEKEIANIELKNKVIPIIIVRTLPNGDVEHWKLQELEIVN